MARTIGRRKVTLTIPAGPVAVPISTTNKFVTDIEYHFPVANVATEGFIGDSTVDATWIPRASGLTFNMAHGTGQMDGNGGSVASFNLAKIFVFTVNAGDTCIVEFMDYDAL